MLELEMIVQPNLFILLSKTLKNELFIITLTLYHLVFYLTRAAIAH